MLVHDGRVSGSIGTGVCSISDLEFNEAFEVCPSARTGGCLLRIGLGVLCFRNFRNFLNVHKAQVTPFGPFFCTFPQKKTLFFWRPDGPQKHNLLVIDAVNSDSIKHTFFQAEIEVGYLKLGVGG